MTSTVALSGSSSRSRTSMGPLKLAKAAVEPVHQLWDIRPHTKSEASATVRPSQFAGQNRQRAEFRRCTAVRTGRGGHLRYIRCLKMIEICYEMDEAPNPKYPYGEDLFGKSTSEVEVVCFPRCPKT
jgi:hypothetical protein